MTTVYLIATAAARANNNIARKLVSSKTEPFRLDECYDRAVVAKEEEEVYRVYKYIQRNTRGEQLRDTERQKLGVNKQKKTIYFNNIILQG